MRKILFWVITVCTVVLAGKAVYDNTARAASVEPANHRPDWHKAVRSRKCIETFFAGQSEGKLTYLACSNGKTVQAGSEQEVELLVPIKGERVKEMLKASSAIDLALQEAHIANLCFIDSKLSELAKYQTKTHVNFGILFRFQVAELLRHESGLAADFRNNFLAFSRDELEKECRRYPGHVGLRFNWAVCSLVMNEPLDRQLDSLTRISQDTTAPATAHLAGEIVTILRNASRNGVLDAKGVAGQTAFLRKNLPDDVFSQALCLRLFEKVDDKQSAAALEAETSGKAMHDQYILYIIIMALVLSAVGTGIALRPSSQPESSGQGEESAFQKNKGFPLCRLFFTTIFSIVSAIILIVGLFCYEMLSEKLVPMSAVMAYQHPVREMLQETLCYLCGFVPIIFWSYVFIGTRNDVSFADFIHLKFGTIRHTCRRLFATGLKLSVLDTAVTLIIALASVMLLAPESVSEDCFAVVVQTHRLPAILEGVFTMVILAPIIEEILFRGLLYAGLRTHGCAMLPAMIISAVVFAAAHGEFEWTAMTVRTVSGLIFAFAFERTKSIVPSMVAHGAHNSVASLLYLA
jgi:membrane protease YdiL (CAAX protease family)